MRNITTIEKVAYSLMAIGCTLDHVLTSVVITHPFIFELNENVQMMMDRKIWLISDIALVVGIISLSYLFIQKMEHKKPQGRYGILVLPAFIGFTRLLAAIWNVGVYLRITGVM